MRFAPLAMLAACFSCGSVAASPAGQPDPAFGVGGKNTAPFDLGGLHVDLGSLLAADPSGRLYVVGSVELSDNDTCLGIARFLPDGALDTANYGEGGLQCHDLLPGGIELMHTDAAVLPNGMLLVAGADELSGHPVVCRFDAGGELDIGFGSDETPGCRRFDTIDVLSTRPNGAPDVLGYVDMAIAADRIHVAMQAQHDDIDVARVRLARLTFDGDVVPFGQLPSVAVIPGADPSVGYHLSELALDADGRLLVLGATDGPNDLGNDFYLARIDAATGALDPTFNTTGLRTIAFDRGGSNNDVPVAIALLSRDRILVAGAADTTAGMRPAVVVLDDAGQSLGKFNGGKQASYNPCVFYFGKCQLHVMGASALPQEKLLLAGYAIHDNLSRIFTLRLNSDGTPDASYGANIPGQTGFVLAKTPLPQRGLSLIMQGAKPVLGGWEHTPGPGERDFLVTRLSP